MKLSNAYSSLAEKDWSRHKEQCNVLNEQIAHETPLDRNLRHWTRRFNHLLRHTGMVALDLDTDPRRTDTHGIIITLLPRPHQEIGSRFIIDGVAVVPLPVLQGLGQKCGMDAGGMLEHFNHHRQRTLGTANPDRYTDFAIMLVIALNEGEHTVPGHASAIRAKPLCITAESFEVLRAIPDWKLYWEMALRLRVRDDTPMPVTPP